MLTRRISNTSSFFLDLSDLVDDLAHLKAQYWKLLVIESEHEGSCWILEGEELDLPNLSPALNQHLPLNIAHVVIEAVVNANGLFVFRGQKLADELGDSLLILLGEGGYEGLYGLASADDVVEEDNVGRRSVNLLALGDVVYCL